ncbi:MULTISPECIES: DUF1833 family protein [Vibrio harveyi group]|uniref:DUF1833 family protein n=3 Tax=Vibrionaceae TaxID=641 RepID=UPI0011229BA6|nr:MULTISPECIES: DUF1833 family protein [Vibrio harveyi group]EJI1395458.1 DUF1833 family protein [Vibrio parahaemolyticus]ELB1514020.1 DUF1833 family protein [Vibrio alginolyticus]MCS0174641.1 DUF1833 domain-containing protein [Vibrio alginolyticus]TOA09892.1 hypothetical protein CGK36_03185 [Vibrio parahaemolyticus]TOA64625.1 hypothetical protein CGK24_05815 [Vibrio parahaemolyticus]
MKAIEVYYASAPVDKIPIHTIEIKNEDAYQKGEPESVIRLADGFYHLEVDGVEGIYLGLETGVETFFRASAFRVSLPGKSVKGKQNLQFQIDNVTGEARRFIDKAMEDGSKVTITYRFYLYPNISAPAEPPLTLTAVSEKDNIQTVSVVASFHDLVNRAWPKRRYTPAITKGLKYQGS